MACEDTLSEGDRSTPFVSILPLSGLHSDGWNVPDSPIVGVKKSVMRLGTHIRYKTWHSLIVN